MSEILKIEKSSLEFVLEYSTRLILAGRVVSFPTDTYYALGADPLNLAAINDVFRLKRRASGRPFFLGVSSRPARPGATGKAHLPSLVNEWFP